MIDDAMGDESSADFDARMALEIEEERIADAERAREDDEYDRIQAILGGAEMVESYEKIKRGARRAICRINTDRRARKK